MPETSAPLDCYNERSLFGRCRFTLFADRVELRCRRNITVEFESSCPLADLSTDTTRMRIRHPWWVAGVLLQIVPFSMFCILRAGGRLEHGFELWLVILLWTLGLATGGIGLWLVVSGFPKHEYVIFHRQTTRLVALQIGRAGPDRNRFDDFVGTIKRQAEACRTSSVTTSPNSPSGA